MRLPPERLPAAVETAAYLLVAAAVEDAGRAGAGHVAVDVERDDGRLRVRIADGWKPPQRLVDRVGALGGRVSASEVELPCA